jgi:hypothetical protein
MEFLFLGKRINTNCINARFLTKYIFAKLVENKFKPKIRNDKETQHFT